MNIRRTALISLVVLALAAAVGQAETLLTREKARALALESSKTLQRALLSVDSSKLAETMDSYGLLPSLSAGAAGDLSYPRSSLAAALGGSVSIEVSQVIWDGRIPLQIAIDALDTEMAREQARAEYFSVLDAADRAFAGVVDALATLDAAQSDLEAARSREGLAQARLEAGIIIRPDLLKAESETAAAETTVSQARGRLSAANAKLASLTGLTLPFAIDPSDPAGTETLTERLAGLTDEQTASFIVRVQEAVAGGSPSLDRTELAEKKAAKSRDLARADGLPSVSSSLSNRLGFSAGGISPTGSLSVNVSIPLSFWRVKAAVEAGETALRQAGLDLGEARRTAGLDAQSAVYELISAARSILSSRKALEYAQSHYDSVLEKYRLSTVSASDLTDAASLVSTARSQSITARSQLLASLTSLRTMSAAESESLITGLLP